MRELFDEYQWNKNVRLLPHDYHKIPGLYNFMHSSQTQASKPTPPHYHSDIIEFHFLVKGQRQTTVVDEKYTIIGNEMLLTFPYEMHQTSGAVQSPCEFYAFQIGVRDKEHLLGLEPGASRLLAERLLALPYRHLAISSLHLRILKKAAEHLFSSDPSHYLIGAQYLSCLLFEVCDCPPSTAGQPSTPADTPIHQVVSYIGQNFSEDLRLQQLAELSGYSLSRFKSKFKEEVGFTPSEFITRQRIEYARQQLELTDQPLTEIGIDAGFMTSNYFSMVFKKYVGCTPSSYRKIRKLRKPG
ncbi:MAG: AraC family transcriptional regulator [Eubacteriales bacterium]|nr:AraC family transcriptional regulator [Eubacteriales bacterium]